MAVGDDEEVAGAICSKPKSEHLPGNFEHPDTLHEIAEPVRSLQKAPRELVGVTNLCLCEVGSLTLDELVALLRVYVHRSPDGGERHPPIRKR